MKIGLAFHAGDRVMDVAELAREAEARGFHSLYIPEHTHIPASRRTPPPTGEAELDEAYYRSPDPLLALAAAAAQTGAICLGTGVALPLQHDPIAYAKQVATLDVISGGRFVFGIGYGWNREEMENHGVDPRTRRARLREHLLAMQALWSRKRAAFSGAFVNFEESFQWPKPVQQPRPPVLLGGAPGPTLFAHVAEYCDGWMPIGGAGLRTALPDLQRAADEAGRDFSTLRIVPFGVIPEDAKLEAYRQLGAWECALRIPAAGREQVLPVLDRYRRFLE